MSDRLATALAVVIDSEGNLSAAKDRDEAYAKLIASHGMEILKDPTYKPVAQRVCDHIRSMWSRENQHNNRSEMALIALAGTVIPGTLILGSGGARGPSFEVHLASDDMRDEEVRAKTATFLSHIQRNYMETMSYSGSLDIHVVRSGSDFLNITTHSSINRTRAGNWQVLRAENSGPFTPHEVSGSVVLRYLIQEVLSV